MILRGKKQSGFSLLELSIVLVIVGLLSGGIMAGQSLIRAAEIRSVATDLTKYQIAFRAFRDKYSDTPGDMNSAENFWGTSSLCGGTAVNGTCNGNGNGLITVATGANLTGETFQGWRQLTLAGLLEGNFTGAAGPGSGQQAVIGTNVPRGRINNSGASFGDWDNSANTTDTFNYALNYPRLITFGATNNNVDTSGAFLKPEEIWNIDTKLDDGRPGTGNLIALYWAPCSLATSATDFTAAYRLDTTTASCAIRFRNVF